MTRIIIIMSSILLYMAPIHGQTNILEEIQQHFVSYDSLQKQEKVYVQTDRTLYQPGEQLWFNVYVTGANNGLSTYSKELYVELLNPKGAIVQSRILQNKEGCSEGHFDLSSDDVGGIYKIRAYSYWMRNFSETFYFEKEITLQEAVFPNVLMHLDFEREAYGPNSQVVAEFEAKTKENAPLANKALKFEVMLAGNLLCTETSTTDEKGKAYLVFNLPNDLATNEVLLNIQFGHEALTEAISRAVPVVLNDLDVQFLPEGGTWVANQKNRMAVKVLNEFGKPADIKAELLDEKEKVVATFESYHQGMGAFDLIPQKGKKYHLKIIEPQGMDQIWTLPEAKDRVGLYLKQQAKTALTLDVYNQDQKPLYLIAQQQGKVLFSQALEASNTQQEIIIPTEKMPLGILQITLFDQAKQPICERLAFVNKHRQLTVDIRTNKKSYLPREEVEVELEVKDETGRGVVGDFSLAVVNDQQHHFIDDKQDDILSYLLMSSDLKGTIFEPNFYFDPKEIKADTALDYVMLTHGWRRYNWLDILATAPQSWLDSIIFEMDSDEISGYLKIDGKLFAEKKIFLYEQRPINRKKEALLTTWTTKNGFFKFKKADLDFPMFVAMYHQGTRHVLKINGYSKAGLKLLRAKDAENYLAKEETPLSPLAYGFNITTEAGATGIAGRIIDLGNDEGLPFANVVVEKNGELITGTQTDFDGFFLFNTIEAGTYDVLVSYVGFPSQKIEGVTVDSGIQTKLNIGMEEGTDIFSYTEQEEYLLIDTRKGKVEKEISEWDDITIISKEDIMNNPERGLKNMAVRMGSVNVADEGEPVSADGSRATSNDTYVDGVLVPDGALGISDVDVEQMQVITSGVPAEYESGKSVECFVRGYRIPLIDPSNTSGGQTLSTNDIDPRSGGSGSSGSQSRFFKYNYDPVDLVQVGIQTNYFVPKAFYSPKYSINEKVEKRTDFRQTIYWTPNIKTNSEGKASLTYCNSDEVSSFRIIVEGIGKQGQIGHGETSYAVSMPFSLMAQLPASLSYYDTLELPIQLKNNSAKKMTGALSLDASEGLELLDEVPTAITIDANEVTVIYLRYKVKPIKSKAWLKIAYEGQGIKDAIQQAINIYPKGFDANYSMSGFDKEQIDTFIIDDFYDGSLEGELQVYPNIMDGLMDATKGLIRAPYGCFEQVSSSNYPNILALQLMDELGEVQPEIRHKAMAYLKTGYKKLAAYEIEGGGFDWYGHAPANEGLSAYGLVQFEDMKAVYSGVEQSMIERTKKFLLNRRDGNGGFHQHAGRYGFSGNRKAVFNAYITWALAKTGTPNIKKEVEVNTKFALESKDVYLLSLACLTNFYVGNTAKAEGILAVLESKIQLKDLESVRSKATLTNSWGISNNIESLSFVALAMMASEQPNQSLLLAIIQSIQKQRNLGCYGSTQSTVMALTALCQFQQQIKEQGKEGAFTLLINGKEVLTQNYKQANAKKMRFTNLAQHLNLGSNIVRMEFRSKDDLVLPFAFDVNWKSKTPPDTSLCPLKIQNNWNKSQAKVGETVRLEVNLKNQLKQALPSPMAVIGIPAGLTLQAWQLKELQEKSLFDYYELKDNTLILYFRGLHAEEERQIAFDLRTEIPGRYTAPASNAYLYYMNELKDWQGGHVIRILK